MWPPRAPHGTPHLPLPLEGLLLILFLLSYRGTFLVENVLALLHVVGAQRFLALKVLTKEVVRVEKRTTRARNNTKVSLFWCVRGTQEKMKTDSDERKEVKRKERLKKDSARKTVES